MNAHDLLIAAGFVHTYHEEDCEDRGDGESGPMVTVLPAYHEYVDGETYWFFDEDYKLLGIEIRDHKLEAWLDAQYAEWNDSAS